MRTLELALLFVAVFAIAWPAVFGVRSKRGIAASLLVAGLVLQLQIEGFRWQLIPLYLVAVGLALGDILFIDRTLEWTRRVARGLFGLAGVALVAVLPIVLPVPELPLPSGPESIGTITAELVDTSREEIYGESPGGPRRVVAQIWYPSSSSEGIEPTLWSEDWDVVAPAMATRLGFPSWTLNHTRYTESHAQPSVPVAEGTFPVVIYSHGWTGFRTIGVNQVETLTSNGYLVIAVDHTHGAVATRFDDGTVVEYDPAALPDEQEVGEEAHLKAAEQLMEVYAGDLIAVLDALEEGQEGPLAAIADSADLTRIGIFGHSTGGGAAVRVCLLDERCDAVLGFDAWVEPLPDSVIKNTATRPALFMRSDGWRGTLNDSRLRGIAERSEAPTYWLGVEGADHNDFVVTPLLSPWAASFGLKGSIPSGRIIPIIDNYLLGFFDVFLLGTGSAALDAVGYEEVTVEVINR